MHSARGLESIIGDDLGLGARKELQQLLLLDALLPDTAGNSVLLLRGHLLLGVVQRQVLQLFLGSHESSEPGLGRGIFY